MRALPLLLLAIACALGASPAGAAPRTAKRSPKDADPVSWCAPEVESLGDGVCHIDGGQPEGRRTLVIFLHGAIAKNVKWQWTQERALLRQAKASKFEALFPRAPLGESGYLWPGSAEGQKTHEEALLASWRRARKKLEARRGRPFDEVFVMGFSSGAYYVSSLANRGAIKADGFGVFAGGALMRWPVAPSTPKPPFFVGVCADDSQTATHGRGLGGSLSVHHWPHKVDERHVGHMYADGHVASAIAYLRAARDAAKR
jgi:predicted esterase